jgi:hypothetical protein
MLYRTDSLEALLFRYDHDLADGLSLLPLSHTIAQNRHAVFPLLAISLLPALSAVTQGGARQHHGHDQSSTDYRREDFFVDGHKIPGISEYVPVHSKTFAGNLPVDEMNVSRTLYFWLVETDSKDRRAQHDLIIWLDVGEWRR